jgi:hypothetical protein
MTIFIEKKKGPSPRCVMVRMSQREALMTIKSLTKQMIKGSPNLGR